jgi:hypothetical protein
VIASFTLQVQLALNDLEAEASLGTLEPALEVISTLTKHRPRILPRKDFEILLPDIFVLAYLLPECYPSSKDHTAIEKARELWGDWVNTGLAGVGKDGVLERIKTKLRALLCDTQVRLLYVLCLHLR